MAEHPGAVGARWHILTGEYPPQPGGVSDYTGLVAAGLAAAGAEVHVWAPPAVGDTPEPPGVRVHREAGAWGPADLRRLDTALDAAPGPRRLLVQYAPNAWGRKGLNLGFGRWLRRRRAAGDAVWLMVHEVRYPFWLRDRPWRWVLTVAHRRMIRDALAAADRVFHTTVANGDDLRRLDPRPGRPVVWLPVPSNVPVVDDPVGVAEARARLAPGARTVVGSFGTYGGDRIGSVLGEALAALLAGRDDRVGVLIGRGGDRCAADLRERHPALGGRLVAPGGQPAGAVSRLLQACDLMVLPYSDGVSTRRGTVMAALAHGLPTLTTSGENTEAFWAESDAVALVPTGPGLGRRLADAAEALLAEASRRTALGVAARALYDRRFALGRTLSALLGDDARALEVEPDGPAAYTAGESPQPGPGSPRP